jgi:hypothetical protein
MRSRRAHAAAKLGRLGYDRRGMRASALLVLTALSGSFALGSAAIGCSALEPVPPPPLEVVVRVNGDPGQPIKGAALLFNGQKVSTSGDDGVARLKLTGKDGESFDVAVSCPDGFQSPSKPIQVVLKRLADDKKPEYDVACPPTVRTVVVAVRADGGANLPVLYLGREVARTDTAGAAHVLLKLKPDEPFDLVLGTTENASLRPQNPFASFVVKDHDDVFVFDQRFEQEKKKPKGGGRRGPVRIGGK